jgi:hypothetical protein
VLTSSRSSVVYVGEGSGSLIHLKLRTFRKKQPARDDRSLVSFLLLFFVNSTRADQTSVLFKPKYCHDNSHRLFTFFTSVVGTCYIQKITTTWKMGLTQQGYMFTVIISLRFKIIETLKFSFYFKGYSDNTTRST